MSFSSRLVDKKSVKEITSPIRSLAKRVSQLRKGKDQVQLRSHNKENQDQNRNESKIRFRGSVKYGTNPLTQSTIFIEDILKEYAPLSGAEYLFGNPSKEETNNSIETNESSKNSSSSLSSNPLKRQSSQISKTSLSEVGKSNSDISENSEYDAWFFHRRSKSSRTLQQRKSNVSLLSSASESDDEPLPVYHDDHQAKTELFDNIKEILTILSLCQQELFSSSTNQDASSQLTTSPDDLKYLSNQMETIMQMLNWLHLDMDDTSTNFFSKSIEQSVSKIDSIALIISRIAKKLLSIQSLVSNWEQTSEIKLFARLILAIRMFLESGELPKSVHDIQMDLQALQSTTCKLVLSTQLPNDKVYRQDRVKVLRKLKPSLKKTMTIHQNKIEFENEWNHSKKSFRLSEIWKIYSLPPKAHNEFCFVIKTVKKKYTLAYEDKIQMAKAMLTIDGLVINLDLPSKIESNEKTLALKYVYKPDQAIGGMITSSFGEKWKYRSDGTITNMTHDPEMSGVQYGWSGHTFYPIKNKNHKNIQTWGIGRWNGLWATWHENMNQEEPVFKYFYDEPVNTFLNLQNPELDWKWNDLSLVCTTAGEWFIEGNIPPVVVFFLQLLRYYRFRNVQKNQ